jgi:uncharacterized protein YodC (DUF2158 family)
LRRELPFTLRSCTETKGNLMATKSKFEVGETVKLKSGGPVMTVRFAASATSGGYTCQWFAGKKLEQGQFAEESLVKAEPTQQ